MCNHWPATATSLSSVALKRVASAQGRPRGQPHSTGTPCVQGYSWKGTMGWNPLHHSKDSPKNAEYVHLGVPSSTTLGRTPVTHAGQLPTIGPVIPLTELEAVG